MKTIGLLGGMSWESTVTYYQLINEAVKEKLGGLHSAKIVLHSVDFDEIEKCQSSGDWARSGEILGQAAAGLERAGADFILICTNTMHKVAGDVQAHISVPLLHIGEVTARALLDRGIHKAALLGTRYTMEQDFYKDKLAAAGAALCVRTLEAVENGTAVFEKQGESPTAYAKMLDKKMGDIDWSQPAVRIERLVRGLNSWPSAYTHWNGKVVKIWRAKAEGEGAGEKEPGTVISVGKNDFTVQTGSGILRVYELQIPGKKRMETGAFLRGYALEEGTVFTREERAQ